mgnify:CR=1 FL=1
MNKKIAIFVVGILSVFVGSIFMVIHLMPNESDYLAHSIYIYDETGWHTADSSNAHLFIRAGNIAEIEGRLCIITNIGKYYFSAVRYACAGLGSNYASLGSFFLATQTIYTPKNDRYYTLKAKSFVLQM